MDWPSPAPRATIGSGQLQPRRRGRRGHSCSDPAAIAGRASRRTSKRRSASGSSAWDASATTNRGSQRSPWHATTARAVRRGRCRPGRTGPADGPPHSRHRPRDDEADRAKRPLSARPRTYSQSPNPPRAGRRSVPAALSLRALCRDVDGGALGPASRAIFADAIAPPDVESATVFVAKHASRVGPADGCSRDCISVAWQLLDCCSHARPAARDVYAAPLAPCHPRDGGQALDASTATDALSLEAVLLHLDTDVELHRLSHGPGDAVVSPQTTRRLVVVLRRSEA